ncbi:MAG: PrgI family protein [Clostridia bacterium]
MAYVPIPKDLSNVKTKVMFNLTKRQLICFGLGALVGLPVFFIFRTTGNTSVSVFMMMFTMFPFFMFAMYEKHNQPLEVILKNYLNVKFLSPKKRPYRTDNFYNILERQDKLDKEVQRIVKQRKIKQKRAKTDRNSNRKGKKQA